MNTDGGDPSPDFGLYPNRTEGLATRREFTDLASDRARHWGHSASGIRLIALRPDESGVGRKVSGSLPLPRMFCAGGGGRVGEVVKRSKLLVCDGQPSVRLCGKIALHSPSLRRKDSPVQPAPWNTMTQAMVLISSFGLLGVGLTPSENDGHHPNITLVESTQ